MTPAGWIDVHHHILPPFYLDAMRAAGAGADIRFPDWRPEDSLEVMDRHGVAAAVVSVSTPGVHFGDDTAARVLARRVNEYAAGLVRAHPTRFGAFASLPLPDVDGALTELAYALDDLALDGVVLLSSAGDRYLGDPAFEAVFAELDRRRAVAFLHPTIPPGGPPAGLDLVPVSTVEFVADTSRAIANLILSGTLERYPSVSIIAAHAGGFAPYITDRLQAAWERDPANAERAPAGPLAYLQRLFYDTALSANAYSLLAVRALAGAERVVLGTDFPFVHGAATGTTVAALTAGGATDPARRLFRLRPEMPGTSTKFS